MGVHGVVTQAHSSVYCLDPRVSGWVAFRAGPMHKCVPTSNLLGAKCSSTLLRLPMPARSAAPSRGRALGWRLPAPRRTSGRSTWWPVGVSWHQAEPSADGVDGWLPLAAQARCQAGHRWRACRQAATAADERSRMCSTIVSAAYPARWTGRIGSCRPTRRVAGRGRVRHWGKRLWDPWHTSPP